MFFERKEALKRNVATRQPARFVRHDFAEQLSFWAWKPIFTANKNNRRKAKLNKAWAEGNNKNALSTFYDFLAEKKLIVPNFLTFEAKSQVWQTKVACEKSAADWWLKIIQVLQQATKFSLKKSVIAPDEPTKKSGN